VKPNKLRCSIYLEKSEELEEGQKKMLHEFGVAMTKEKGIKKEEG